MKVDVSKFLFIFFLEFSIGFTQKNVIVMEGNNATLCVDFSSEFESNFRITVRNLLTNLTLDDPGKF